MKRQIPNMLSVLRLLMIPAFAVSYFEYTDGYNTLIAAGIYVLAWFTDALDGYLARRNSWITDVGKWLDPLADKLMQLAAAICFTIDNKIFLVMLIPLVIKELCMLLGGLFIMKKHKIVVQAHWYGKVATVILFLCAFTRIIVRGNAALDIAIAIVMLCVMIFSLVMYYLKDFKGKYNLELFGQR